MQLKEQSYHRDPVARESKHDVDMSTYNTVSGMISMSRESTWGQVGWLSAGRNSTPGGLEKKPAAKWGNGSPGDKPNRPPALLGEQYSFFIPSGGERATHTLLCRAVSDSRSGQG